MIQTGLLTKYGAGGTRQPYVHLLIFQNFAGEERQKQYRTKNNRKMEEGKNEIMELRQMIEGCFERQNKLIARLEMELEALSNFNGKQMLDSRDMRLQLKVCDRTLIRWRMSGKLPSFKISGKVYQNENALPLGYTTAHVITRAEYEKLSSLEKQQTLLQGVVLDSVPTGMTATKPTFTDKSLPYTIVGNDDAAVEGQKLHIYKKKGSVTIQFTGSAAQETYLRFTLNKYSDYAAYTYYKTQENDPLHRYNKEKWEKKDDTQKALVKQSARKFKQETLLGFRFGYSTENISVKQSRTLNFASAYELRFDGYKTYTVNAGYSKDAKTDITVTFDARGIYDFSTLEVLEQPMTDTNRQVAKLAENTLENIQIGTDTVDGTVTLDRSKILLLPIPYCDGWTATVDGKEAQLLQANTMFSALALEPGEHTIHLTYRTPHLKAGLAVSVLGFAAFGATLLCTEVKKRKERKA